MVDGEVEVARWEHRRCRKPLSLLRTPRGFYHYSGDGCGGTLADMPSDEAAIAYMEENAVKVYRCDRPTAKRVK